MKKDLNKKLSQLSPEKRELLEKKLRERAGKKKKTNIIPRRKNQNECPMSFAQERLWFLNQLNPDSPFYNIPAAIKIKGELNINAFIKAFENVIERHEILSVVFKSKNEGPEQYIKRRKKSKIDIVDLSTLNSTTKSVQIKSQFNNLSSKPFELSEGPLFRATLIKVANDENIFIICFHHIIADGWSIGVFINDLLHFYKSGLNSRFNNLLEPLDIQYFDFSSWQKQKLEKGEFDTQLDYWKKELKNIPELLDLPLDNPRRSIQTFNGKNYEFKIPNNLKQKLIKISKESNASMFMVLLAAFQILIRRFSGQKEFGIGIPAANRNHPQIKNLIGFFVNSLVIRSNIDFELTFSDLLEIVKEKVLKANENQDIPFEKIVESLGIKKDISHTPLFQVMFDFQINPLNHISLPGINLEVIKPEVNSAKFDLLLLIEDSKDKLICSLEYNSDLFNATTIANLIDSFLNLLDSITSYPNQKLKYLNIIDEKTYKKIVYEFNNTLEELSSNKGVHNFFEDQVKLHPEKVALEFESKTMVYEELNRNANRLARYLKERGVKNETSVGIAVSRSFEQIIAVLAVTKCGGVYVPIDISYPDERISIMIKDSGIKILLVDDKFNRDIPDSQIRMLNVVEGQEKFDSISDENLDLKLSKDNGLYIMYTSGSTGIPKGVTVRHAGVMRLVKQNEFGVMDENQIFLNLSSFSFDAATLEIWGSLGNGAKLVLHHSGQTSLGDIAKIIKEKEISFLWLTAGLFNTMVEEKLDDLIKVKQILTGGDVLSVSHVNKVLSKLKKDQILVNGYGPTENTTFTSCYKMYSQQIFKSTVPIGRPIKNTQVYILDETFNIQPIGVVGELCIGGYGLARNYHNDPVLTANKFIPNPFSNKPAERLYRTGDLAKINHNGMIEFIGRIDNQIKLRGFRIELGEIEAVLQNHSDVENCIVIVDKKTAEDAKLIAYVKIVKSSIADVAEIKRYLNSKLPDYMIPTKFVKVDKFNLNPNGKIDRKKLPEQVENKETRKYLPPRNTLENYLVKLWEEVLEVENISIYDNFFELGGNSLKAAVLINRIQKEFARETHVGVIFKAPRVAEFAMFMVEYFPDIVKKHFGRGSEFYTNNSSIIDTKSEESVKISKNEIVKFNKIININRVSFTFPKGKNKKAIFILSPPRSGSTLLRIMLAGSEKLFSPPELDLLSFDTMKQRRDFLIENNLNIWLESTTRAVMEIKNCSSSEAEQIINELVEKDILTLEFYSLIHDWLVDKLLVDKTPSYAMDYKLLERAEENFDNPLYIHLTRHPYAMIYSFIEAKLDEQFFRYKNPFSHRELAELIWLISNKNVLEFSKTIPSDRIYRLNFENLVFEPEVQLRSLCKFIGIDFTYEMLNVYKGKKMTDGIKKTSQMVGDFKFYMHNKIDTSVIDRWKNFHRRNFLSEESIALAKTLGYSLDNNVVDETDIYSRGVYSNIIKIKRDQNLPLSYSQQRLWFIDQIDPGRSTYNIPTCVKLKGELDKKLFYDSLEDLIKRHESLRTIFPDKEGKVYQEILSEVKIKRKLKDLRAYSEEERKKLVEAEILETAKKPFDLSRGPLLRIKLLQVANREFIFLASMHHIITDGWSVEIFIKELAYIYTSKQKGAEGRLPNLPIQYVDYAYWQRKWMESGIYLKQLAYWKEELMAAPSLLELPTDYKRGKLQGNRGDRICFEIKGERYRNVMELSIEKETTLYVIYLMIFNVLLSKYSNSRDILIGTPVAGRIRKEIENVVGLFVNTLVIRTRFDEKEKIEKLIDKVKGKVIKALDNQEVPFEKLIDELKIQRSLSHSPLFQVMFVFNESPMKSIKIENIQVEPLQIDIKTSKFDMNFVLTDNGNRIKGEIEYNTDLFKKETIERFLNHFEFLLNLILENTDRRIDEIELVTESEKQQLINIWNKTEYEFPNYQTLPELFEEQVNANHERTAVEFEGKTISYRELSELSNALANNFIQSGVKRDEVIGLYMYPSLETIITIMGILKSGAAYLPLDPTYPEKRIEYMLNDSNVKIVCTQNELENKLLLKQVKVIPIELNALKNLASDFSKPNIKILPENLAYVIYTSGSTGQPKGVMLTHKGVINHLFDFDRRKSIRNGICSLWTSSNFDVSVYEIFYPLIYGNELHIVPHEIRPLNNELFNWLYEHKVNSGYLPPFMLDEYNEWLVDNHDKCYMQKLLVGVEPIKQKTLSGIYDKIPEVLILNGYGPTETTVCSTIYEVKEKIFSDDITPIGKAMSNTRVFILDEYMNLSPIGVPGEIYIESIGEARGYLNKPSLTAEKFVPNPFGKKGGDRLYRTGDLAFYQPDGTVKFIGRIDNQIKFKGFRIELGEIEENIKNHHSVSDAAVVIREDQPGIKKLVGYFTLNDGEETDGTELRNYLNEILPEYMIPSLFVKLDKMPKTPNGKIDRKNLPVPTEDDLVLSSEFIEAESDTEKILLEIWKDVLKVNKIGTMDNFFELGGDSILGIQVIAKANSAGLKLSPKNLFEAPTIMGLANLANKAKKIVAEQGLIEGEVPLTPIQKWFFEKEFKNPNHWNQSILLEVTEKIDTDIFYAAVKEIMKHHDVLRLRFLKEGGNYRQIFSEMNSSVPFEVVELTGGNIEKTVTEKSAEFQSTLNIEKGPLFKIVYFKLIEEKYDRLLIIIHHLVVDGVSWRILLEDLQTAYEQLLNSGKAKLPPKTTSFKFWAERLKKSADEEKWISELKHWEKVKKFEEYAKIPVDFKKGENIEQSLNRVELRLPVEMTEIILKETVQKFNTSVLEILLTAFVNSVSQWSGKRKLLIGMEGHGREDIFDDVDISRTLGWFTSIYPVLIDLKDSVNILDSIKYVKEQFRKIPNNGMGYGILKYLSNNKNVNQVMHEFSEPDIMFNYLGVFNQNETKKSKFKKANENSGSERALDNIRANLLDVTSSIADDVLTVHINYSENFHKRETIKKLTELIEENILNIIHVVKTGENIEISTVDFEDAEITEEDLDHLLSEMDE